MADLSQVALDGTTYNLKDATARKQMVYYATGTGTAGTITYDQYYAPIAYTSTAWKATISSVTSYYDGLTIAYKIPVADPIGMCVTFEINSLGKHPVISTGQSGSQASFNMNAYKKDAVIFLVYCSSISDSYFNGSMSPTTVSGCWVLVNDYDSGHYAAYIRAGASNSTSNAATTSGNTYLNLVENNARRSGVKLVPGSNMTITSDASGNVTFTATDTTYSGMTSSEAIAGTDTTNKLVTAAILKDAVQAHNYWQYNSTTDTIDLIFPSAT